MKHLHYTLYVIAFLAVWGPSFAMALPPCSTSGHAGNSYETCAAGECERMVCNGSTYVPLHSWGTAGWEAIKFGNDTSTCNSSRQGRLRYTGAANWDYCNGTAWVSW